MAALFLPPFPGTPQATIPSQLGDAEFFAAVGIRQSRDISKDLNTLFAATRDGKCRSFREGEKVVVTLPPTPCLPGSACYSGRVARVTRQGYHVAISGWRSWRLMNVTFRELREGVAVIARDQDDQGEPERGDPVA